MKASECIRRAALRQKIVVVNDVDALVAMAERNRHLAKIAADNPRLGNIIHGAKMEGQLHGSKAAQLMDKMLEVQQQIADERSDIKNLRKGIVNDFQET